MKLTFSPATAGAHRRPSLRRAAVAGALAAGVLLAGSPARGSHDADEATGAYEPHAGYVAPARSPGRLAPATGALMGTHSHDDDDLAPEEQGIVQLEQALGRTMDINNRYYGDFDAFAEAGSMSWMETWDIESGRIPLVGWGCTDSDKIRSGALDNVIRTTAQVMKAFGHEFFMRYCWEMDGRRKQDIVKGPEEFVAAWRHMWRIFQAEGATNVIWAWTANAAGFKDPRPYTDDQPPAPFFYPGDDYVDWIASDGYNWGVSERDQGDRWRHALEIFDEFMVFARQHPKPIMIGEYGVQEQPNDPAAKPDWFRKAHQVFMDVPKTAECPWCGAYSDIAAVVYFDVDYAEHGDWRIMSSPESQTAFREAATAAWFNQIHTIGWGPAANRPGAPPSAAPAPPPTAPPGEAPPTSSSPPGASPPSPPARSDAAPRTGYWM
ncbi:MAG: glycoside hydrolase family 26 protein, partial [Acidimicrobiia bacterium]